MWPQASTKPSRWSRTPRQTRTSTRPLKRYYGSSSLLRDPQDRERMFPVRNATIYTDNYHRRVLDLSTTALAYFYLKLQIFRSQFKQSYIYIQRLNPILRSNHILLVYQTSKIILVFFEREKENSNSIYLQGRANCPREARRDTNSHCS